MATSFSNILYKPINSLLKSSSDKSTKANPRYAFQYDINMDFIDADGNNYHVNQNFIKYVSLDFDYEVNTIPVIYVSFAATNEIYDLLMKNERTGKVFFSLYRDNKYSNSSLSVRTIEGEFSYIPSTGNINYISELVPETATADNSYRTITIALIDEIRLNLTKMYTNRIFHNIDTNTLIGIVLEGLSKVGDVIIKAPKYSVSLETEIIPPITSIKTFFKYLFNQAPFYDTDFIFFLDFDRCYLLDKNGEGCEVDDGTYHSVIFDISEVTDRKAYYEGIEVNEEAGAYIVYINPANANAAINRSQDRVANRLVVINENGYDEEMDVKIDVNSTAYSADKLSFIRATDAKLIKNIMESNTVFFTVQKPFIDAQIFTPNKKYSIQNYAGNKYIDSGDDIYNGEYTLAYKKEIIVNNGGTFNESSEFGLRKVGNITNTEGIAANIASNQSKTKYTRKYNSNQTPTSSTKPRGFSRVNSRESILSSSNKTNTNDQETVSSKAQYIRPVLNASGPSKAMKATEQNPNLMRKINYNKGNRYQ